MKKRTLWIILAALCFAAFAVFTYLVQTVDVQPIGPLGSSVGFAAFNKQFADAIEPNEVWFEMTNLMGYLSIFICAVFGAVGFKQLVQRKSLLKVDRDIIWLGVLYIMAILAYFIFKNVTINYRPVLENGVLEPSYPSSHTVLGIVVFASLLVEIKRRVRDPLKVLIYEVSCMMFIFLIVFGRLISGWHWVTDIIGGIILSLALIFVFLALLPPAPQKNHCDYGPGSEMQPWAEEAIEKIKESAE